MLICDRQSTGVLRRGFKKQIICHYPVRESSFDMTRGGGGNEDIETQSLKFWKPPLTSSSIF